MSFEGHLYVPRGTLECPLRDTHACSERLKTFECPISMYCNILASTFISLFNVDHLFPGRHLYIP